MYGVLGILSWDLLNPSGNNKPNTKSPLATTHTFTSSLRGHAYELYLRDVVFIHVDPIRVLEDCPRASWPEP